MRLFKTSVNAVYQVSVPSTSAQSLADIAFFDAFVFWVAPHDGQVMMFAVMLYGFFFVTRFHLTLEINVKFVHKFKFFDSDFFILVF